MAIVFELVVNCGTDETSARRFAENVSKRLTDVQVGNRRINIHHPLVYRIPDNDDQAFLVSIVPKNIGYTVALDKGADRIPLTSSELTELGNSLYEFIRGIPDYRIALVGWDVDWLVSDQELKSEWSEELAEGAFDGLVLANDLLLNLPGKEHFVTFDDNHSWIPYKETRALE